MSFVKIFHDWVLLFKDFTFQNSTILQSGKEINSENELWDKLYSIYRRESRPQNNLNLYDIRNAANELVNDLYPDDLDKKWQIKKINEDGTLIIRKGYTEKSIIRSTVVLTNKTRTLIENPFVDLLSPRCVFIPSENEGWIWIFGKFFPTDNNDELIRYYFNFNVTTNNFFILQTFISAVVFELNLRGISFKLKFINKIPFNIADSFVIYIEKFHYISCFEVIESQYKIVKQFLIESSAEIPLFTHKVDTGWGFAEEPKTVGDNLSFGRFRTQKIAQSIWKNKAEISNSENPIKTAFCIFIDENKDLFDFNNFHLNKNSFLQLKKPLTTRLIDITTIFNNAETWALDAAILLGYHICRQAIWDNFDAESNSFEKRKCNWLHAVESKDVDRSNYKIDPCNPYLGDGLSGILFFLVKLYQISPSRTLLDTLHGTINNIIVKLDKDENSPIGLFNGQIGTLISIYELSKIPVFSNLSDYLDEKIGKITTCNSNDCITNLSLFDGFSGKIWGLLLLCGNIQKKETKDKIKSILLSYKELFLNIEINSTISGLKGLSGIAMTFAEFGFFLNENGEDDLGEKYKEKANELFISEFEKTDKIVDSSFSTGLNGMLIARIRATNSLLDLTAVQKQIIAILSKININWLNIDFENVEDFTLETGVLGLIYALKNYSSVVISATPMPLLNSPTVELFMKSIYEKTLKEQSLPPMSVSLKIDNQSEILVSEYYNPGLLDGLSGLGLFFLKFHSPSPNFNFLFD